jgi:hypothetical protein
MADAPRHVQRDEQRVWSSEISPSILQTEVSQKKNTFILQGVLKQFFRNSTDMCNEARVFYEVAGG